MFFSQQYMDAGGVERDCLVDGETVILDDAGVILHGVCQYILLLV
jgi:hypothetical protein